MRCRIPIIYLVDSSGVNLPYQGGVFPGQYGASRLFYYNSIMRRYLRIPQLAAVMGPCIAGGAYLPALSDLIVMVKGTSFMGLGGPNLVKGATGQTIDGETLGGAVTHTEISGVAHYAADDDDTCLAKLRDLVAMLPAPCGRRRWTRRDGGRSLRRAVRSAAHGPSHVLRHARAALGDRRRRKGRRVPGASGARDDLWRRADRRNPGGRDRQSAWPHQGTRWGKAPLRRNPLRGKRREGGVLHRSLRSRAHSAAVHPGRVGFHGRPRSGARGNHSRRRSFRGSDGDGTRSQDRVDGEPRVGRRLLRHGWAGVRSRLHLQLAHRSDGR